MNYDYSLRLVYPIVFALFLSSLSFAQSSPKDPRPKSFRSAFRYVIFYEKIDPRIDDQDEDRRFVGVLLEKRSFSKRNLSRLFRSVSDQYSEPQVLTVELFTDLTDVQTPEEAQRGQNSDEVGELPKHNHAVFIRGGEQMFFYIYYANGGFDEVELK